MLGDGLWSGMKTQGHWSDTFAFFLMSSSSLGVDRSKSDSVFGVRILPPPLVKEVSLLTDLAPLAPVPHSCNRKSEMLQAQRNQCPWMCSTGMKFGKHRLGLAERTSCWKELLQTAGLERA